MLGKRVYMALVKSLLCCSPQNFIFSPFHFACLTFSGSLVQAFLGHLARTLWYMSRFNIVYCNVLACFSLNGYLCIWVNWIGRRNRSASSASNAVKFPKTAFCTGTSIVLYLYELNEWNCKLFSTYVWHLYCFSLNGKRRELFLSFASSSGIEVFSVNNFPHCNTFVDNVIASN